MRNFSEMPHQEFLSAVQHYGQQAELHLIEHPGLAALRTRQAIEAFDDLTRSRYPTVPNALHSIVHRSLPPMCSSVERRVTQTALRDLFERVSRHLNQPTQWRAPQLVKPPAEVPRFATLQLELNAFNDRVNRRRGADEAPINPEVLRQAWQRLKRRVKRAALSETEREATWLYRQLIERDMANHAGLALKTPRESDKERVIAALNAGGLPQRLAIELRNRQIIALTNTLQFERAWLECSDIYEHFVQSAPNYHDYSLGALTGTFGQILCFIGEVGGEPDQLREGLRCFEQAQRHFSDPGDLERQETYQLHALSKLNPSINDDIREHLTADCEQISERVQRWISGDPGSRKDYLIAAWLKAQSALGLSLPSSTWSGLLQRADKTVRGEHTLNDPMNHGALLLVGWIALSTPKSQTVPRWLVAQVNATGERNDIIGLIARFFAATIAQRDSALTSAEWDALGDAFSCFPEPTSVNALRAKLGHIQAAEGPPISVIPFNFA